MESFEQYLKDTEQAVRQLFNTLSFYEGLLEEIKVPVRISDSHEGFEDWIEENKEKVDAASTAIRRYIAYSNSENAICGSIFQIAHIGIQTYGKQHRVPDDFATYVKSDKIKKFCVGRNINGVPLGLVIYATRNLFNHSDDKELKDPSKEVFRRLAEKSSGGISYIDPAFDLSLRHNSYTKNVFWILEWRTFEQFKEDMIDLV